MVFQKPVLRFLKTYKSTEFFNPVLFSEKEILTLTYDVAIIGAGAIGCALARELSKRKCKTVLIEKENDVAMGTTCANSAIIHAGYDPKPGTLMAKYNAPGNRMTGEICEELDVPFRRCGSFVLAFDENDMETVRELFENGTENGVPGMEILSGDEVRKIEPNVSEKCVGALFAPSAGIISPWEFALAMAEQAVRNGVELRLSFEVDSIKKENGNFMIRGKNREEIEAKFVVNAAGVYCDSVAEMIGDKSFSVNSSKGQYYILDKNQGGLFEHVMFQCPGPLGKGILVSPTIHGNLMVGPDANPGSGKDNIATDRKGLEKVIAASKKTTGAVDFRQCVKNFAGVRCEPLNHDFIIGFSEADGNFLNLAGIKSPGLSSSPAIAADAARMLFEAGVPSEEKEDFITERKILRFRELSDEEKAAAIEKNPAYGRIICRCETITEGEIISALRRPIVPKTLDGIKRRCGAGMGRCQGGFCGPRVLEIISRELGIEPEKILLNREGSYILSGKTGKGGDNS